MTQDQINYQAAMAALSNSFVGEVDPYSSFSAQAEPGKLETYDIQIKNKTGAEKTICLVPASIPVDRPVIVNRDNNTIRLVGGYSQPVAPGKMDAIRFDDPSNFDGILKADAVVDDGIVYAEDADATIEVSSPKKIAIRNFFAFLKHNVCKIEEIQINANDGEVFSSAQIVFKSISPFNQTGSIQRALSDFVDPKNNNNKKIIIHCDAEHIDVTLDDQTAVFLIMPGEVNGGGFAQMTVQFKLRVFNQAGIFHKSVVVPATAKR